jgi:hypothetical protein
LFESGVEAFDDLLSENIWICEVIGFFEAFVTEPKDIEAGLVAVESVTII